MTASRLSVNVVYNLVGTIVPVAVTIVTIPRYLHVIGEARFGVLSLIWIVFGYFGLFDFGLSRATTNRLAKLRGGDPRERNAVFYTALATNLMFGLVGAVVFYAVASPLIGHIITGKSELIREIPAALPWIGVLIPLGLLGGVFAGCLEAEERFLTLNVQQIVGVILQQSLPLAAVLTFGASIEMAAIGAVAARLVSVAWNGVAALRLMSSTGRPVIQREHVWPLLKYGGNVAVTNAISPLLVSADQFVIASLLGAKAVAFYTVPFNIAMKALVVPGALTRALFPRLSGLDGDAASTLAERATVTLVGVMAFICAPAILISNAALILWLGPQFAAAAAPVAQLLLVGTWINGLAFVPFALLQGQGRPDIVAKFHVFELVPFVAVLWVLVHFLGLPGAAIAWCLRVAADAILLFWAAGARIHHAKALAPAGLCVIGAWLIAAFLHPGPRVAIPVAILLAAGIAALIWTRDPILSRWIETIRRRLQFVGRS